MINEDTILLAEHPDFGNEPDLTPEQTAALYASLIPEPARADLPVWDIEELSWADMKSLQLMRQEMGELEAVDSNMKKIMDLTAKMEALLEPLIISIPNTWFVKKATPEQRTGPGRLGWLKHGKFQDVFASFDAASSPDKASGE